MMMKRRCHGKQWIIVQRSVWVSNLILFIGFNIYIVLVFIFVIEHLCCFIKFVKSSVILIVCTYEDRETRNWVESGYLSEKPGISHKFSNCAKFGKILITLYNWELKKLKKRWQHDEEQNSFVVKVISIIKMNLSRNKTIWGDETVVCAWKNSVGRDGGKSRSTKTWRYWKEIYSLVSPLQRWVYLDSGLTFSRVVWTHYFYLNNPNLCNLNAWYAKCPNAL